MSCAYVYTDGKYAGDVCSQNCKGDFCKIHDLDGGVLRSRIIVELIDLVGFTYDELASRSYRNLLQVRKNVKASIGFINAMMRDV